MYASSHVTSVRVGRNAGDGHGDMYHVETTYREDDEEKLEVHVFNRIDLAWGYAAIVAKNESLRWQ